MTSKWLDKHPKFTIIKETIPITWCKQWIKDTDLARFAEDTDFHSFGEKLEDFLKKANLRQTTHILQLSEDSMKFQKMTGQPKDPWLATWPSHV